MSIRIDKSLCRKCGKCTVVCPGNLIKKDENGYAYIKREKDCWGCTSCLKECCFGAILFYLGEDIGGKGSTLSYSEEGDISTWTVSSEERKRDIVINRKESNNY